jgi:outer membrane protein
MTKKNIFRTAVLAFCAALGSSAHAQFIAPDDVPDGINLVGIAVGMVPDWMGSGDTKGAAGPIVRYQFEGTKRYFLWLGPQMQLNLIDSQEWRAGPMLNYRGEQRGSEADDPIVSQMQKIKDTVEAGAFLQYNMPLSNQRLHQIVFGGDVAGGENGWVSHLKVMWWQPIREGTVFNLGVGMTIGDDKWMNTYFGIRGTDLRFFPSQGGRPYEAASGISGINIPFGITQFLSKEWLLSAGGRIEFLQGDAKDSPLVQQRGDDTQVILGVGLSYMF